MPAKFSRQFSSFKAAICAGMLLLASSTPVLARPSAMKLFPEETLVFVRMSNAREFGEHLSETSTGRMLRDPQLKPFVDQLYGRATEIYAEQAEDKVGLTWDDLKKLPQGETADVYSFALRRHEAPFGATTERSCFVL